MADQFPETPSFNFDLHAPLRDIPDQTYTPTDMGSGLVTRTQTIVRSESYNERLTKANELEKIFNKYDKDGSQRIDKAELRSMLRDLGMDDSPQEVDKLMGEADNIISDGQLNFSEMYQVYYGQPIPAGFKSQFGIDVYATGISYSAKKLNLSKAPKLNYSHDLPTISIQEETLRGGDGNYARLSNSSHVVQETPSEIQALYAIITKMQSYEVGTNDQQKMKLRQLVEELIQDYNSNDQMSKEATINIAKAMISEFESTLTQVNDLKIQISTLAGQKSSLEQQYAYYFEQLEIQNGQLDEKIAAHRSYCSELHTQIQTDTNVLSQRKVSDDENHKERLKGLNVQVGNHRQQTHKEVQDHEGYLKEDYSGKVKLFTDELNAEKAAVLEERRQLEFYIKNKKGELSDMEKIQEALLRAFRQEVKAEKAKLMGHASNQKSLDIERLRGAKTQFGLGDESERMKIHNSDKQQITIEMDQINKAWQSEKEAFAREKADWMLQHEQWKKQQLLIIQEERSLMIRNREESNRSYLHALEQQKAEAEREIGRLSQEINSIRIKITDTRNGSLNSINAWLIEEKRKLESRFAELQASLTQKQNQFKADEAKIKSDLQSEASELYKDQAIYQTEFKKWHDEWSIVIDRARELSQIVNLNVGGKNISVSVANLTSVRNSKLEMFFKDMNRHKLLKKDNNGRVFLDRDPKYFEHMLNYIANNGHVEPIRCEFENDMFENELLFWGIHSNSEFVDRIQDMSGKKFTFKTMDTSGNKQQAQLRHNDTIISEYN